MPPVKGDAFNACWLDKGSSLQPPNLNIGGGVWGGGDSQRGEYLRNVIASQLSGSTPARQLRLQASSAKQQHIAVLQSRLVRRQSR